MDDTKAAAAHHPEQGPSESQLHEGLEYDGRQQPGQGEQGETAFIEMQAEAEAGETQHDAEAAAADKSILDQLRDLYSFDAFAAETRSILAMPERKQEAAFYDNTLRRVNATRLLLGVPIPTQQELAQLAHSISAEQASQAAQGDL